MGSSLFKVAIIELIPQLRAYALMLTRSACEADDLVQDALVRAWSYRATFQPDAQLKPWLFKILRTRFYSDAAKRWRMVEDVDGLFAAGLTCAAEQSWRIEYDELRDALNALSHNTREAVLLVLSEGLTYEEAAQVCACPAGTMKSRVNRGREQLTRLLDPPTAPARPTVFRRRRAAPATSGLVTCSGSPSSTISVEMETR
jgi:RNA polymerase sigma-70 factor (ECF subfamily)